VPINEIKCLLTGKVCPHTAKKKVR
jgi:hypothetical protein